MEEISKILSESKIDPSKLQELVSVAKSNPFAAIGMIQQLGLSPETLQKLMAVAMSNPSAVVDLAKSFGIPDEILGQFQKNIQTPES